VFYNKKNLGKYGDNVLFFLVKLTKITVRLKIVIKPRRLCTQFEKSKDFKENNKINHREDEYLAYHYKKFELFCNELPLLPETCY
jgi:hypothetical protein